MNSIHKDVRGYAEGAVRRSRPRASDDPIGGFFAGLFAPWRGLGFLIGHPSLWHLAVLPFLLSLAFYVGAMWLGWHFAHQWLAAAFDSRGAGWKILEYLLAALYWIAILIVSAVAFVPVASLIASPFNDTLSEKTEQIYLGVGAESFSVKRLARSMWVGITGEIARAVTLGALLIAAFCLNFIPGAGSAAATAASAFFTIYYLSLEFTSFSMDRRTFTWPQRRAYLARFRARTLGFGTMAFGIMMIPIVNALFIPVSAVAGTLLFCDTELRDRQA